MIKGIVCEGDYEYLKDNDHYNEIIQKLKQSDQKYLVGIDLPSEFFVGKDYPVITWMSYEVEGGELTVEGSETIPIKPSF